MFLPTIQLGGIGGILIVCISFPEDEFEVKIQNMYVTIGNGNIAKSTKSQSRAT